MQELLGNFKETSTVSGPDLKNRVEVDSSSPMVIVSNILLFKVGDYIDLYGTYECVVKYGGDFEFIPPGFELRIRALSQSEFSIFYPMGYIVWKWLNRMEKEIGIKIFKSVASENENGIPYVKIWRAK